MDFWRPSGFGDFTGACALAVEERRAPPSDGRRDLPRRLTSSPCSALADDRALLRLRLAVDTSVERELERVPCSLLLRDRDTSLRELFTIPGDLGDFGDFGSFNSLFPAPELYLLAFKILCKLSQLGSGMTRRRCPDSGGSSACLLDLEPFACGGRATTSLQLVTVVTTVSVAVKTDPVSIRDTCEESKSSNSTCSMS